ncbi:MAG: hypothetical protein RKP46_04055 [Candidatus Accumulibacter sp.]|uniref:hypothetical protein n=1 Tax=Accumulibacter sp. TaxID=2053492 RepID=UPI00287B37A2|nr:hypothetical protein [Accumulibacter sp.]MDS4013515.1 hypothetical protein [Accumulibacter sp.]
MRLDLTGDGARQRLMARFDVLQRLRQENPQDQRGDQQQRRHAGQREAQSQPQPQRARDQRAATG